MKLMQSEHVTIVGRNPAALSLTPAAAGSVSADVRHCISYFKQARGYLMLAARSLYFVREQKAWESGFSSWNEFLGELQLDPAQASRLCAVVEHYLMKGGVELTQLKQVNPEKLYRAMRLPYTPQEQALRAATWTTQELKAELSRTPEGYEHMCEAIKLCKTCGKRM